MPKSETGMRTNKSGFTLVEILVVVVILGLTASMAMMAFGDFGKSQRIEAEAERLKQKIELIRYHAILEAIPYRLQITPFSYQFFKFAPPNQWKNTTVSGTSPYHLPEKIQLSAQPKHSIVIQSSGEVTQNTFKLAPAGKPATVEIVVQKDGRITLKKLTPKK